MKCPGAFVRGAARISLWLGVILMEGRSAAIELESIRKTYRSGSRRRRRAAVEDVSLTVEPSQIFGLLGPNGAGKTTTLKVLLGLIRPDGGQGRVLGGPLGDRKARMKLGFLPEQPYFYGFLTAEKALDLYGRFFGLGTDERKKRSEELLDLVGLARGSHLALDRYSKGMLQRFGIAQALVNDPELVILDEPSSGLDPVGQKELRDILLGLKADGKTLFLSSHQLSEVEQICDTVCIVSGGRTVREGALSGMLAVAGYSTVTVSAREGPGFDALKKVAQNIDIDGDRAVVTVPTDRVYEVIDLARGAGLELISVTPGHRSLEDLFIEAVKEDRG